MFGFTEWIIIALIALIVFGVLRSPSSSRQPVRAIEDMRVQEPVAPRPKRGIEFEILIAGGFILAAIACVLVLVLAQSGWV